eukprot:5325753-Amphidinium_carterae.1
MPTFGLEAHTSFGDFSKNVGIWRPKCRLLVTLMHLPYARVPPRQDDDDDDDYDDHDDDEEEEDEEYTIRT